ncbi:uncharacterized protein EV422DRAFT_73394 [Fimicolochytrium jonesii]|uniref:uncharacterized protein n=1 Tax=Fimicolochytrium jonesii TaxID=1396493 RepID=UPI0022FF2BBB|nr:uncharacterized protein EV422DRAFT_73394 [Fimicolochytrium jonesii]KAI8820504.1 hypothetical protein EV422DRAFT_73394 [Fimicolochytrium jonesii]
MGCKSCGATDHQRRNSKKCPRNLKYVHVEPTYNEPNLLSKLPLELKDAIANLLDVKSLARLSMVDRNWNMSIDNDDFWERSCRRRGLKKSTRVSEISHKNLVVSSCTKRCVRCLGKKASPSVFVSNLYLCRPCGKSDTKITVTRARKEYKLNDQDLAGLPHVFVENPHYRNASAMTLYQLSDIVAKAHDKYGGPEGLLEAQEKGKKRSEAILRTKAIKRDERRAALEAALEAVHLELREDSVMCEKYVNGVSRFSLEETVGIMIEAHVRHEHSPYETLLDSNMDEARRELGHDEWISYDERRSYFQNIRDETEDEAVALYESTLRNHADIIDTFERCRCGKPLFPESLMLGGK